jgi:hypothetical protein
MPNPSVFLPPSITLPPGTQLAPSSYVPQLEGDEGDTDLEGNPGWGRSS